VQQQQVIMQQQNEIVGNQVPNTLKATELMHRKQSSVTSVSSLLPPSAQPGRKKKKTDSFSMQAAPVQTASDLKASQTYQQLLECSKRITAYDYRGHPADPRQAKSPLLRSQPDCTQPRPKEQDPRARKTFY